MAGARNPSEKRDLHWIVQELIRLAQERKLSLEQLAISAGLGRNALYWWKRGEVRNPSLQNVDAVARVLGYELDLMLIEEPRLTDGEGI